jgi:hypothetical protein
LYVAGNEKAASVGGLSQIVGTSSLIAFPPSRTDPMVHLDEIRARQAVAACAVPSSLLSFALVTCL